MYIHSEDKDINNSSYSSETLFRSFLQVNIDTQSLIQTSQNMPRVSPPSSANETGFANAPAPEHDPWKKWNDYYFTTPEEREINPEHIQSIVNILPDKKARVLDVGTGWGVFPVSIAEAARNSGKDVSVDALDLHVNEAPALKEERAQGLPINKISSSFQDFSPGENIYNYINANESIFYIPPDEQKKLITTLIKALKQDGILLFNTIEPLMKPGKTSIGAPYYGLATKDVKEIIQNHDMKIIGAVYLDTHIEGKEKDTEVVVNLFTVVKT
jgi:2-polyprenyl-3-methyl-5-hydroxy-6-metoxy-1,4-benzoquinol methylase